MTIIAFPGHAGRCWPLLGWRLVARIVDMVDQVTDQDSQDPTVDDDAVDAELTLEADPVWLEQIRAEAGDATEDPELTVDASPELVDVIRQEIARRDATPGDGASPSDDPVPSPAAPPPTSVTPPPETPPAGPGRWQPQQRLAARAPVIATTPIVRTDHHHRTKDSTKIVLAAIAAIVIVAVAWLLVGGETADAPPSIDTSTTVAGTQTSSGVTTPASTPP